MPDYEAALTGDVRGLRIGIPREYRADGMPGEIEALWQRGAGWLRDAGAEPVEISLPHTRYALPAYYIIAPAEASSNLARYDGVRFGLRVEGKSLDEMYELTRAAGFGAEVRRRVLIGTYVLSAGYYDAYYLKAQRVRALVAQDFAAAFERVDCLLGADRPLGRLCDRRDERRPGRDVSERFVHRAGEPRRIAGDLGPGRAVGRRAAARPANHRPRLCRGNGAARRRGAGERRPIPSLTSLCRERR